MGKWMFVGENVYQCSFMHYAPELNKMSFLKKRKKKKVEKCLISTGRL